MPIGEDEKNWVRSGLSGVNVAILAGLSDSNINDNTTIDTLKTAVLALGDGAGWHPDALREAARSLQFSENAGILSDTHGATTKATLRAEFTNEDSTLSSTYSGAFLN